MEGSTRTRFLAASALAHALVLVALLPVVKDRFGSRNEPVTVMLWSQPRSSAPPALPPPSWPRTPAPSARIASQTAAPHPVLAHHKQLPRPALQPKLQVVPPATPPAALAAADEAAPDQLDDGEDAALDAGQVAEAAGGVPGESADLDGGVAAGAPGGVPGGSIPGVPGGSAANAVGAEPEKPLLLGSGMSRPHPASSCRPERPAMPEQARLMGISGKVTVEFVVHPDGHVGEIGLKNDGAPPVLYGAVKQWLEGCRYVPSILETTGKPIPVRMLQQFNFSFKA